jgi:nucleoside-diphosphate-sugar epimerase
MKAFVTGATGFIGGELASFLVEHGWEVVVLVRSASLAKLRSPDRFQVVEGDLEIDRLRLKKALSGCDVVFHNAAIRNRWGTTPEAYRRVNVEGVRKLLEASVGQAQRFVYMSSVGVIGPPGKLDFDETHSLIPLDGMVGYHESKALAELLVLDKASSIETVVVRPTITYGPGDWDGMLTRLISMIIRKRFVRIGRGENHIHLTYIIDLLQGIFLAATHPFAPGNTYIVAGPRSTSMNEILQTISLKTGAVLPNLYIPEGLSRLMGMGLEYLYWAGAKMRIPAFRSEPQVTRGKINTVCVHRGYSSRKAQKELGYSPQFEIDEGIDRTLSWMNGSGLISPPIEGKRPGLTRSINNTDYEF